MRIDYRGNKGWKGWFLGRLHENPMPRSIVTDLDTGRRITPIVFADDATGDFEQIVILDGKWQIDPRTQRVRTMRGKARINRFGEESPAFRHGEESRSGGKLKVEILDQW
jgi:hypothetical protein